MFWSYSIFDKFYNGSSSSGYRKYFIDFTSQSLASTYNLSETDEYNQFNALFRDCPSIQKC